MKQKLRQITDTIHQTVYLSELESEMMSTAYFYRLHDVYQSSTVYLTFPCNRTKRYEHSYGTMALAGEIFFSAITNADAEVLKDFLEETEQYLIDTVSKLFAGRTRPTYCESSYSILKKCFNQVNQPEIQTETNNVVQNAYINYALVEDLALSHYMPPFSSEISKYKFLYQCLLEAVRIAALFHDVGHPPYSHIMETILDDLFKKCNNQDNSFNKKRAEDLLECLHPYKGSESDNILCFLSDPHEAKSALHEQVGLRMLACAFDDTFFREFANLKIPRNNKKKVSPIAVYYIAVAEFCFAILRDQNPFFTALHRIIDGTVDADRMDYIVRDTLNSGVNWGTIPYKRLLDSCKLVKHKYKKENYYRVAYQKKMTEDIDDLLITRYKIFSRINYHHRSYKTALILQRIVKKLAEDYLSKDELQKSLCPGIADLWNCLSSTMNSGDLYIIQWNDSTLTAHLYKTLADMKKSNPDEYGISEDEFSDILSMLDEFLLNHKHFYSVFKRQADQSLIFKKVFERLAPDVNCIIHYEQQKFENCEDENAKAEATDSLKRMDAMTLNATVENGDADALLRLIPIKKPLGSIIQEVLCEYKLQNKINAYIYAHNHQRTKTGLPKNKDLSDAIFLYGSEGTVPEIYDVTVLSDQLCQLQRHCLEYIAYIEPIEDIEKVIIDIREQIADRLYMSVRASLQEMFSCLNV